MTKCRMISVCCRVLICVIASPIPPKCLHAVIQFLFINMIRDSKEYNVYILKLPSKNSCRSESNVDKFGGDDNELNAKSVEPGVSGEDMGVAKGDEDEVDKFSRAITSSSVQLTMWFAMTGILHISSHSVSINSGFVMYCLWAKTLSIMVGMTFVPIGVENGASCCRRAVRVILIE